MKYRLQKFEFLTERGIFFSDFRKSKIVNLKSVESKISNFETMEFLNSQILGSVEFWILEIWNFRTVKWSKFGF